MRRKLRTAAGRARYGRRKQIVEPRIGTLKEQHGMRRFRMRGLAKVAVEFTLASTAMNLTRLCRKDPMMVGAVAARAAPAGTRFAVPARTTARKPRSKFLRSRKL